MGYVGEVLLRELRVVVGEWRGVVGEMVEHEIKENHQGLWDWTVPANWRPALGSQGGIQPQDWATRKCAINFPGEYQLPQAAQTMLARSLADEVPSKNDALELLHKILM